MDRHDVASGYCLTQTYRNRSPTSSGVPQGHVLGPLIFPMYINDLHTIIISKILKFSYDSKLCYTASNPDDITEPLHDIRYIVEWADKLQMNVDIYSVMHIGHCNYSMVQWTVVNNKLTARPKCYCHQRPQVAQTTREELQKSQCTWFISRNFKYNNK